MGLETLHVMTGDENSIIALYMFGAFVWCATTVLNSIRYQMSNR